ncbi:prophage regulatory protein [Mesorhizobium soli]|uniref:helix-turn-helix transcriptional regulator n=1 Tax=Pseudaminobacter soli (ex Li et al. 2025) TaxID=1295366 RepID=UPI00247DF927|nr:prophage regulatory protein [Mesorhizobium soli]
MSQPDRFIRLNEVETLTGFKHSFIYSQIKNGDFPPPLKFGYASRWSLNAVQAWMAEKLREAA